MTQRALKIIKDSSKQRTALYATAADFCRIFNDDMKNLYLLSLALTADPERAEECFVSGLEDCAASNQVFKEWARSWARRVVIKNAIRMIAPSPEGPSGESHAAARGAKGCARDRSRTALPIAISTVFELQPFERFAFVMSVLEGYSDQDCALLLGCTRESLVAARVCALQWIGRAGQGDGESQAGAGFDSEQLLEPRNSVEEMPLPVPLGVSA